ncbi:MAG: hypothetical protein JWP30_689 [Homoserinimonas sp.]|jgi:putative tricarboxylic transport membrane protein|nr:hypothetical protein [Homoserinimonas sp.]
MMIDDTKPAGRSESVGQYSAEPPEGGIGSEGPALAGVTVTKVIAIVCAVVGVLIVVASASLGPGSLASPKHGTWPLGIGVALVGVSVILFLGAKSEPRAERFGLPAVRVALAVVSLVTFAILIELIGFEIPCALIIAVWMRLFGGESWRLTALVSIVTTAGFYFVFVVALGVPIPHLLQF